MLENLVARLPTSDLSDPPKPSTSSEPCNVARACEHKWYVHKGRHTFYAAAHITLSTGKPGTLLLHRLLTGAPATSQVDHHNGKRA